MLEVSESEVATKIRLIEEAAGTVLLNRPMFEANADNLEQHALSDKYRVYIVFPNDCLYASWYFVQHIE